jgi:DNA repair protein RecO (recombination protein O)
MEYRYTAIVLGKKEVGETDRLYTFYTREQGKVRVVAKGVRKPEAKLAGQLENLSSVSVIINKTRGMGKITSAIADESFVALRKNYEILLHVSQSMSLFESFVDMDEPDSDLYLLIREYLVEANRLAQEDNLMSVRLLTQGFLFQVFTHLGYHIETLASVHSGDRLTQGEKHFFSPEAGGVITESEVVEFKESFYIQENAIKLMRLFATHKLTSCLKVKVGKEDIRELEMVSRRFADWIAH